MPPVSAAALGTIAITVLIATLGGAAFAWFGWPAGWLMGATVATAAFAVGGRDMALPRAVREGAFLLLGASIGSAVTPEALDAIATWPGSVVLFLVSVLATLAASSAWLRYVHRWDRETAAFSSMPGAFSTAVILASETGADVPRVVLAQGLRVFTLVALLPPLLSLVGDGTSGTAGAALAQVGIVAAPWAIIVTLAGAGIGAAALQWMGAPAASFLGAMVVSSLLHVSGLVEGKLPQPLVIAGFIATGAVIGARFRGTTLDTLRRTIPGAIASILIAIGISAGIASFGAYWLDLPYGLLWIAYAPGGVEAMAAMALALHLDPAFVSVHHVLRILSLNAIGAFLLGRLRRMRPGE